MSLLKRDTGNIRLNGRTYVDIEYVDRGGSGEVYRALHEGNPVALKLFLPFYASRQMKLMDFETSHLPTLVRQSLNFQQREFKFVSKISHPNVVRAIDSGELKLHKDEQSAILEELGGFEEIEKAPLLVSEFVEGLPLERAITEYELTPTELAHALERVAYALDYLHERHAYMHTDVRSANVLIRQDIREPILIDFALCKNFNFDEVEPTQGTRLIGDRDLLPDLHEKHPLREALNHGSTRQELKDLAFPALDLFQFGALLKEVREACSQVFDQRELRYLRILEFELTKWDNLTDWQPGNLGPLVERLSPHASSPFGVSELAAPGVPERTLVIPGEIAVPLTKTTSEVINTKSFRRLSSVNQLSLIDLVYPGATYKRQVHVLYAYELARQLSSHLYSSPWFRYYFGEKEIQQLLLVVLLHDINHFPFLHTFQESGVAALDKLQLFDLLCDGELTGERDAGQPSIYDLLERCGLSPDRFKRLVYASFPEQQSEQDQIISSIINSGVDIDKVSYLRLDAYYSGVPYGRSIDVATLLKAATVAPIRVGESNGFHLAFGERASSALEHVVFTRYWNFRAIYWHHTNRAIMSMVLAVVRELYGADEGSGLIAYLRQTAFRSETEALLHLNGELESRKGRKSILKGLEGDRDVIYKRLYTLHPATDQADKAIYERIRGLTLETELAFRGRVAEALSDFLKLEQAAASADDVLVDIPKRDLDLGGSVYIEREGSIDLLTRTSKPVEFLNSHYTELSQRARVFVAPWLHGRIQELRVVPSRDDWRRMLSDALGSTSGPGEVR